MALDFKRIFSRVRVPMGFVFAALYFYFARPTGQLMAIGCPIALVGLLLRAWSTGYIRKNDQLATTGPYAFTRNPLYLGSCIIGIGFSLAGGRLVFLAIFLLCFAAIYGSVMRSEEAHLEKLFPVEYTRYRRQVPIFLPLLQPRPQLKGSFSFAQYLKNEEYLAGLGFMAAVGMLIIKLYFF
jgi:protein-S-isoprenylcysteine O-methyltransferase Ste14